MLFCESDVVRLLSDTQASSSLRSQQAMVEVACGSGARSRRFSPRCSPSHPSPSRHRRRDSGSPARSSKRGSLRFPCPFLCPQGSMAGFSQVGIMSFARQGRGLPCGSLGGLRVLGCRCLGCPSSPLWLPHSLSHLSIAFPSELFSQLHQGNCSCGCGGGSVGEGGYRTCLCVSWVLQPSVCYSQGHWRVASGDRSLALQPFVSTSPHFHMETAHSVLQFPSSGGLDGFLGPSRCLPPSSGASVFPKVSEVLRGRFVYQFRSLCFGLATAPQVFTRVMAPVSSIMYRLGFQTGLSSGLRSRNWSGARDFLLWLCHELGIRINLAKSSLTSTQSLDCLGTRLQMSPLKVFPTPKRVLKLSSHVHRFLSRRAHPLQE